MSEGAIVADGKGAKAARIIIRADEVDKEYVDKLFRDAFSNDGPDVIARGEGAIATRVLVLPSSRNGDDDDPSSNRRQQVPSSH